jgi:hypothetical protein
VAKIYSPNESHNCDYGVDFINGVAAVADANTKLIAWFTAKGYTVVAGTDTLTNWDKMTSAELAVIAPYMGIDPVGKTKAVLVAAIETALLTLMKIEITAFDAIADVAGGTVAVPTYANATAVKAALATTVVATIGGGKATVPVTAWVDTDTYDKTTAGKYTFTATLGALPLPYANTGNHTATVEVEVKA